MATIVLRSDTGSWFKVAHGVMESKSIRSLPYRHDALVEHVEAVRTDSALLLERVQHWLGRALQPGSLLDHCADDAFEGVHGIEEISGREGDFWIATGQETHFPLSRPGEIVCPFHDYDRTREQQCQALDSPLINPSTKEPRSSFTIERAHHCCHEGVSGPSTF